MATLQHIPIEVAAKVLLFLSGRDLGAATCSCQLFRAASDVEAMWKKKCHDDFKADIKISPDAKPCKDIYTKLLHKHGKLLGLWRIILDPYGGLCYVTFEDNKIVGYEYKAPPDPHVDRPLRKILVFSVDFHEGKDNSKPMCHKGREGLHDCLAYLFPGGNIYWRCSWREYHQHPGGPTSAYADWVAESGMQMAMNPLGNDLQLMKFLTEQREEQGFEGERIHLPKPIPGVVIQPGLFKGTYGAHGVEIILLEYYDENSKIRCTKITGDPNVPSTKETLRADLTRPMILTEAQQESISMLSQIDIPDCPPDIDVTQMPSQPFCVPQDAYERAVSYPKQCKARFHSEGQISGTNFNQPKFIKGHLVVFNENTFGHLWIQLHSFSLYSRVTEDFSKYGS